MQTFKKLFFLLSSVEQKKAGLLLLMIIIMSFIDTLGIASILPFMAVLANPGIVETNDILQIFFHFSKIFGIDNSKEFIIFLGFVVFAFLVISLTFNAITSYLLIRFVHMSQYSLSKRLVRGYLYQSYEWFLDKHSADLGKNILSEVGSVISNGLKAMIELIAKSVIAILIIVLLILSNPKLTIIIFLSFAISYTIIYYYFSFKLKKVGKERLFNNNLRYTSIGETFGAIKEIKVGGLEESSISNFSNSALAFAKTQATSQIISQIPRYVLEGIAFGGTILLLIYFITQSGSFSDAIPIVSLFVFAGYRIMPALQKIYVSLTQLTFILPALDRLYSDYRNTLLNTKITNKDLISVKKSINLNNITYAYPNGKKEILKNININIPVKSKVGLIGSTGSGKTTVADLLLGLLEPQAGTLEVDGKIISKSALRPWQNSIGYVPQNIYLADDTVEANIAFRVNFNNINQDYIQKAAKAANIHEFIMKELPKQYQTTIGERGIRLSGGQRQRIGIARALYHNPQILIFDEATSALDNQTEKAVMSEIDKLGKDKTIIIIAHRLNTISNCNIIYKFENGRIINKEIFE